MQWHERSDAVLVLAKILFRGLSFTSKLLLKFIEGKPIEGM